MTISSSGMTEITSESKRAYVWTIVRWVLVVPTYFVAPTLFAFPFGIIFQLLFPAPVWTKANPGPADFHTMIYVILGIVLTSFLSVELPALVAPGHKLRIALLCWLSTGCIGSFLLPPWWEQTNNQSRPLFSFLAYLAGGFLATWLVFLRSKCTKKVPSS
jgi:hypothetical protein